jgi:hypothetical protein
MFNPLPCMYILLSRPLWRDYTGPNELPFVFRTCIWVFGERTDHIREAFGVFYEHTGCSAPYGDAYGTAFGSSKNLLCPNELPFVFRIRKWCDFFNWPNVPPNVFSPMYHRMFSVCFPNVFTMVSECFQNRRNTSRMLTSKGFRTLSVCFPNAFRTRRIDIEWTDLFPHAFRTFSAGERIVFGKHSSCSMSIRGVRKAYGTT